MSFIFYSYRMWKCHIIIYFIFSKCIIVQILKMSKKIVWLINSYFLLDHVICAFYGINKM